jgi:hypothetical protein
MRDRTTRTTGREQRSGVIARAAVLRRVLARTAAKRSTQMETAARSGAALTGWVDGGGWTGAPSAGCTCTRLRAAVKRRAARLSLAAVAALDGLTRWATGWLRLRR